MTVESKHLLLSFRQIQDLQSYKEPRHVHLQMLFAQRPVRRRLHGGWQLL